MNRKRKAIGSSGEIRRKKTPVIIFSFKTAENWSSDDDSDDLDYISECRKLPRNSNNSERNNGKTNDKYLNKLGKINEQTNISSKSSRKRNDKWKSCEKWQKNSDEKISKEFDCRQLPVELWVKIFSYAVTSSNYQNPTGNVPFLLNLTKVCRVFREAALARVLWRSVDLDLAKLDRSAKCLQKIVKLNFLGSHTAHLSLARWNVLTPTHLQEIVLSSVPNLTSLNLSFCRGLLTEKGNIQRLFEVLAESGIQLTSLDLSYVNELHMGGYPLKPAHLIDFLTTNDSSECLQHLYLNGNFIHPLEHFFSSPSQWKCASKLLTLDLSGVNQGRTDINERALIHHRISRPSTLPVDLSVLASATPALQTLRLAETPVNFTAAKAENQHKNKFKKSPPLWTRLKRVDLCSVLRLSLSSSLTVGNSFSSSRRPSYQLYNWKSLAYLISNSQALVDLNLSAIDHAFAIVQMLPENVQLLLLNLSRAGFSCVDEKIREKLAKILSTVEDLDLSWVYDEREILDKTLLYYMAPATNLKRLNLLGCSISNAALREIVKISPNLEWINLTSFRDVGRGLKHIHSGRRDVEKLRRLLANQDGA